MIHTKTRNVLEIKNVIVKINKTKKCNKKQNFFIKFILKQNLKKVVSKN